MKKIACNILLAGLASLLVAHAQTNATPDGQPVDTNNPPIVVAVTTTNNVVTETTNQIPPTVVITNATVILEAATNGVPVAGSPAPAAEAGLGIPLIQFSDTALTVAIESLARRAGINYMLDPKIGFGQPDASGQVRVDPTLSIRWENISAENAMLALLDNYNLQLIRDKKTGIDRITQKDPLALPPLITRVIQLKNCSTSNMVDSVQAALTDKRSKVLADSRTSQLIVVATDPEQLSVDTLVNQLDKPTRQVLIQAHFVEITSTPQTSKGIDWTKTLAAQQISFGNGVLQSGNQQGTPGSLATTPKPPSQLSTTIPGTPITTTFGGHTITTTPGSSSTATLNSQPQPANQPGGLSWNTLGGFTPGIGFLNADGLSAVISFLNSSADAQFISDPSLVTLDNQSAHIAVTRAQPIINVIASTPLTPGGSSISYSNLGTILEVTPRILANDYIWLKVIPEISSSAGKDSQTIGSLLFTPPMFDSRRVETQVLIPDSNTLVMGGLVSDNPISTTTKVPILGDIPGLGYAFRSATKKTEKHNLIIFITPTVLKDTDFQPAATDFLKSRPDAKTPVMFNPNSSWDSTKPDWSNLFQKSSANSQ